jgi:hypothetical protein
MEFLLLLDDKYSLIVGVLCNALFWTTIGIYRTKIAGNKSKNFRKYESLFKCLMLVVFVFLFTAMIAYLFLILFGHERIRNFKLIMLFIFSMILPVVHQIILRQYIKWSNGN